MYLVSNIPFNPLQVDSDRIVDEFSTHSARVVGPPSYLRSINRSITSSPSWTVYSQATLVDANESKVNLAQNILPFLQSALCKLVQRCTKLWSSRYTQPEGRDTSSRFAGCFHLPASRCLTSGHSRTINRAGLAGGAHTSAGSVHRRHPGRDF